MLSFVIILNVKMFILLQLKISYYANNDVKHWHKDFVFIENIRTNLTFNEPYDKCSFQHWIIIDLTIIWNTHTFYNSWIIWTSLSFKKSYIRSFLLNQKHLAYIRADIINKRYEIIRNSKFATKGRVLFVGVIIIISKWKKGTLYAIVTQYQISLFKSCFQNKIGIKQPIFVNLLDILIFSELTYILWIYLYFLHILIFYE